MNMRLKDSCVSRFAHAMLVFFAGILTINWRGSLADGLIVLLGPLLR